MSYSITGNYTFPKPTNTRILMMPFIQGDPDSLPNGLETYHDFVERFWLEAGEVGFLTIDEQFVKAGIAQRGYGNSERTLHTEACAHGQWGAWKTVDMASWGSSGWGVDYTVFLDNDLQVLIGNSIESTCAVWDSEEAPTKDGDLGHIAHLYPREQAHMMKSGEIVQIGIRTPHECISQPESGVRQFARVVGKGVHGRADHFTVNPKVPHNS